MWDGGVEKCGVWWVCVGKSGGQSGAIEGKVTDSVICENWGTSFDVVIVDRREKANLRKALPESGVDSTLPERIEWRDICVVSVVISFFRERAANIDELRNGKPRGDFGDVLIFTSSPVVNRFLSTSKVSSQFSFEGNWAIPSKMKSDIFSIGGEV
jgi:hypothetical protein